MRFVCWLNGHYNKKVPNCWKNGSGLCCLYFQAAEARALFVHLYAVAEQECIDGGLLSTETLVERHRMFRASLFEYVLAETRGCLFVIYAVFLEYGECIGIEDFGPLVAVVSCGIASSKDVGECGAASSGRHIGKNGGQSYARLDAVAAMFPTPTASEADRGGKGYRHGGLRCVIPEESGQLNPDWVEWLMGFPPGWTEA